MTFEPRVRRWVRVAGDLAVASAAFYLAFLLRIYVPLPWTEGLLPAGRLRFFFDVWPLVAATQVVGLYLFGLYDPPHPRTAGELARRLLPAMTLLVLSLGAFFFLADRLFPRTVLLLFALFDTLGLFGWRLAARGPVASARRRVVLVGGGPLAVELAGTIRHQPSYGLDVVGWVPAPGDDDETGDGEPAERDRDVLGRRLGTVADLPGLIARGAAEDVILASTTSLWKTHLLDRLAAEGGAVRGNVLLLPGPFESMIGRMRYRWVRDIPLIEVVRDSEWRLFRPVKRALDLALGSFLLLTALPIMAVCALLVRLTSRGPVFYRQERLGRGLQPFTLWKFRTMHSDAEAAGDELLSRPDDPRLTPVGAVLRRLRLDELPQLVNVLGGSMSLVGPRPERPGFVQRYLDEVPGYAERFAVAPGLTGLAQVNGEYHSTARNKLRYDLAYIANWSVWLDASILARTAKIMLTSRGV